MRRMMLTLAALAAGVAGAADDDRAAAEKLKKARDAAHRASGAIAVLSKAAWLLAKDGGPGLDAASQALAKTGRAAKELDGMLDRAVRATDKGDAKRESGRFLDRLKLLKPSGQEEELQRMARAVRERPAGLVGADADDRWLVTPDLLARRPKEAERRFGEYLRAMDANAARLEKEARTLDDVAAYAKAASAALRRLNDGIEKAVRTGLFTRALVGHWLDVDRLIGAYNGLAGDAAAKAKECAAAGREQRRRRDDLAATLRMAFGFSTR